MGGSNPARHGVPTRGSDAGFRRGVPTRGSDPARRVARDRVLFGCWSGFGRVLVGCWSGVGQDDVLDVGPDVGPDAGLHSGLVWSEFGPKPACI